MQIEYWIALGILFVGIVGFFFLSRRKKYRDPSAAARYDSYKRETSKPIDHYKKIRDKATLRELEVSPSVGSDYSGLGLNSLTSIMIGIVVAGIILAVVIMIFGQLKDTMGEGTVAANVSDAMTGTLILFANWMPTVFMIGMGLIVVTWIFRFIEWGQDEYI